jgi:transposase-like protein
MATKRKSYTLEFKLKAIKDVRDGKKKKDVCKDLNIAPSTLSTFLKDQKQLLSVKESQKFHAKTKKMRSANHDDLDKAVLLWIKQARAMGTPVSGSLIMAKAEKLAEKLNIHDFKPNNGWLYCFKIRRSLIYKTICGESASVTPEMTSEWRNDTLPSLLQGYSPDDVYNADETALFYRCLPNKTYTLKGENASRNKKESKDRLTVLVAANMSGTDKLKPLIIGKSANPRCFRGVHVPLSYKSSAIARMTGDLWTWWVRTLDATMRLKKRRILLIIDNCPAHPVIENLTNLA